MPRLETQQGTIFYLSLGTGAPALCCIHGAGGAHQHWNGQIQALKNITHVLTLDLPEHGRSTGHAHPYIEGYSTALMLFLHQLGGDRVVLVGHSMGGAIALWSALTHPSQVAGLILVGTGAKLPVLPALFEYVKEDNIAAAAQTIATLAYGPAASPELRNIGERIFQQASPHMLYNDLCACSHYNMRSHLHKITQPTLILCGDQDKVTPLKFSQTLYDGIPHAQFAIVPDAGHMVMIEKPHVVSNHIRKWYDAQFR